MFGNKTGDGFPKVTSMNHGPDLLASHYAFIGMHDDNGGHLPLGHNADSVTVTIHFTRDNMLAGGCSNGSYRISVGCG